MRAIPTLKLAFWIFWAVTFLTIFLSENIGFSINRWMNNQIYWTFLFLISIWLCVRPGVIERIGKILAWSAIIVSCVAIYEFSARQVPWANSIPSWLKVDDALLVKVLSDQTRAGTDIYRARGTFNVSLSFAEYLAIVYPFLIHLLLISRGVWRKLLLIGGLSALLAAMYFSGARSGMIGFFMSIFIYGGLAALRQWRQNRNSLFGISTLAMLPIAAMVFLALAITWPRLHNMTFGGGQHQPSSEARNAQWSMGMPKVYENPIGHGPGTGGQVLGYFNPGGIGTIDTYFLSLLLEYGFIGFIAFLLLFGGQFLWGISMFMNAREGDESFVGPATVGLVNFVVIKSVLSLEVNISIAFVLLALIFAVASRQVQRGEVLLSLSRRPSSGLPPG